MLEDIIGFSVDEIGFDGEQGCSFSRLLDFHIKRRFPAIVLDDLSQQFILDFLLQSIAFDCCKEIPGQYMYKPPPKKDKDKDKDKGDAPPRPSFKAELLKQPPERKIKWMEENKLVLVASTEFRRYLLVGSKDYGTTQDALFFILDVMARGRELGFVQAEFGKIGIKSDMVFHFLKTLEDEKLIVRVPVISDGMATNLCVIKKFAAKVTHPDTIFYENMVFKANLRQRILKYVSEAPNKTMLSKDLRQLLANDCDEEVVNKSAKLLKREFDSLADDKVLEKLNVEIKGAKHLCVRLLPPPDAKEDLPLPQSCDFKFSYEHSPYYQVYRTIEQAGPAGLTIKELSEKSGNSHKKTHKLVQNLTDSSLVDNTMREFEGKEKRSRIIAKNQLHLSADYQVFQSGPVTLGVAMKEEPVLAGSEPSSSRQLPPAVESEPARLEEEIDVVKPDLAKLKTETSTPKRPIMSVNAIRRAKLIVNKIKEVRVLDVVALRDFLERSEGTFYSIDRKSLWRIVEPLVEQGVLKTRTTSEKRTIIIDATLNDSRLVDDYVDQLRAAETEKKKLQRVIEIDDIENILPKRVKLDSDDDDIPPELAMANSKLARIKLLYNFIWETVFETSLIEESTDKVERFSTNPASFDLRHIVPHLSLKLYGNALGFQSFEDKSFLQNPASFSLSLAEFTSDPEFINFTRALNKNKNPILNLLDGMEFLNLISRDEDSDEAATRGGELGLLFTSRMYTLNKTVTLFSEPQAKPGPDDEDVIMMDAEEPKVVVDSPANVALLWKHLANTKTVTSRLPSLNQTSLKHGNSKMDIIARVTKPKKGRRSRRERRVANRQKPIAPTNAQKESSSRLVVVRTAEENEQLIRVFTVYRSYLLLEKVVNSYMWSKFLPILKETESNTVKVRLSKLMENPQISLRVRKESTLASLQLKLQIHSKSRPEAAFDLNAAIGEYDKLSIPKSTLPSGFALDPQETLKSLSERYFVHEYQKDGDLFGLESPILYCLQRKGGASSIPYLARSSSQPALETEESAQQQEIETLLKVICNMPESPEKSAALLAQFDPEQQAVASKRLLEIGTLVKNKAGTNQKPRHFGEKFTQLTKADKLCEQTRDFVGTLSEQASGDVALSDYSSKVFGILDLVSRQKMTIKGDQITSQTDTNPNHDSLNVKVSFSLNENAILDDNKMEPIAQESSPVIKFLKTFPKPWFDLDKNFLPQEFQRFVNAVLRAISSNPGISQERLVEKLKVVLNEKEVVAVAAFLESTNNISTREVYQSPMVPSLFSPPIEVSDTPKPGFIKITSYLAKTDYYKEVPEIL